MAIVQMTKVIIASYRREAAELLESLQREGIVQVLDAERAMVTKEWPELVIEAKRPKEIEEMIQRLEKALNFLDGYAVKKGGFDAILNPRAVIKDKKYAEIVGGKEALGMLSQAEQLEKESDRLNNEYENAGGVLETLLPWRSLDCPVEDIHLLEKTTCAAGLVPENEFDEMVEKIVEFGGAIEEVGVFDNHRSCLVACTNDKAADMHKVLRSHDFRAVSFEGMQGTVPELIEIQKDKLGRINIKRQETRQKAVNLAAEILKLQVLFDHYRNLLTREQARTSAPATEHVILFEGWVKKSDYPKLEKIVSVFPASNVSTMEPADNESIPVEIENNALIRPFEAVTRLYGMPQQSEVDPTVWLAPFYAIFFGLCLGDAGYGIVTGLVSLYLAKKMQGDKRLVRLLFLCSITTIIAGALTGSWFGDLVQQIDQLSATGPSWVKQSTSWMNRSRERVMWFDPLSEPMTFFYLSLGLGYAQIMFGLLIAFVNNLLKKDFVSAVCDQATWLVMLNSITVLGLIKFGIVSGEYLIFTKYTISIPAAMIFLFSVRQGGWGTRLGMGAYQIFSSIFYMGDVLSYLRLMGLGMVSAGFGMAINMIAKLCLDIPYAGILIAIAVLLTGHTFSILLSTLGAFVHSLRLQFVEFFPKFMTGGGRLFEPLSVQYKHIYLKKT